MQEIAMELHYIQWFRKFTPSTPIQQPKNPSPTPTQKINFFPNLWSMNLHDHAWDETSNDIFYSCFCFRFSSSSIFTSPYKTQNHKSRCCTNSKLPQSQPLQRPNPNRTAPPERKMQVPDLSFVASKVEALFKGVWSWVLFQIEAFSSWICLRLKPSFSSLNRWIWIAMASKQACVCWSEAH